MTTTGEMTLMASRKAGNWDVRMDGRVPLEANRVNFNADTYATHSMQTQTQNISTNMTVNTRVCVMV